MHIRERDPTVDGGMQGDKEGELGLTISPLMDRAHQGGMTRSQVTPWGRKPPPLTPLPLSREAQACKSHMRFFIPA